MMNGKGVKSLKNFLAENSDWWVLDFTGMQLYDQCHRKYQYVRELRLPEHKTMPLLYSSMIVHPTLAKWYKSDGAFTLLNDNDWTKLWNKFIKTLEAERVPHVPGSLLTLTTAQNIFAIYTKKFNLDLDTYTVDSVEEVYWRELPGIDKTIFASKPDLVLIRKGDNALITADFKQSTYDIGTDLIPFDRQFLGQSWAANSNFMMKNFIFVSKNGIVGLTRTFRERATDDELVGEWLDETIATAKSIQQSRETGTWRKFAPKACFDYMRKCEFFDLCELGKLRNNVIPALPKVDPIKYLLVEDEDTE